MGSSSYGDPLLLCVVGSHPSLCHDVPSNLDRIAMFLAFTVYCMAARTVWRKRKELPGFLNPLNEDPFRNMVTTEINIVSQPREHFSPISTRAEDDIAILQPTSRGGEYNPYSVDVEVGPQESQRRPSMPSELMRLRSLTRTAAVNEMNAEAWLYARTSFLFFLALLITWVSLMIELLLHLAKSITRYRLASIAAMLLPIPRRSILA